MITLWREAFTVAELGESLDYETDAINPRTLSRRDKEQMLVAYRFIFIAFLYCITLSRCRQESLSAKTCRNFINIYFFLDNICDKLFKKIDSW